MPKYSLVKNMKSTFILSRWYYFLTYSYYYCTSKQNYPFVEQQLPLPFFHHVVSSEGFTKYTSGKWCGRDTVHEHLLGNADQCQIKFAQATKIMRKRKATFTLLPSQKEPEGQVYENSTLNNFALIYKMTDVYKRCNRTL